MMTRFAQGLALSLTLLVAARAQAVEMEVVRGWNLTEIDAHKYDASLNPATKTEAQQVVDQLYELGVRQITLCPRAVMQGPHTAEIVPLTPPGAARAEERRAYLRLMSYIKGKGMKVGIRPIFFVVDAQGHTPYLETLPDGTVKTWWHGNIQPDDPNAWFDSFRTFLDIYMQIAQVGHADDFTLGAELYSMTVGIEDQWLAHPHGFPGQWLGILRFARGRLGPATRLMYDVNFTDDRLESPEGVEQYGGEFARWRYRLVDLADPTNEYWRTLAEFWKGLDAVGIDMYRSLATSRQVIPTAYPALVGLLQQTADRYAAQIDNAMFEIESAVGQPQVLVLKEIGFRSVDRGFIDPFVYAGDGRHTLNLEHQAAAYEAIFRAFWSVGWSWFKGAVFWDASVDLRLHGPTDKGFSVLGKPPGEAVVRHYFAQ